MASNAPHNVDRSANASAAPPLPASYPPQGYVPPSTQSQGYPTSGTHTPNYPPQTPPEGTQPYTQPVVVLAQPRIIMTPVFGQESVQMTCPYCGAEVITATHYVSGNCAWLGCIFLLVLGCPFGCCLIPFCLDDCKDVIHNCPNCHQIVGRWNRL